MIETISFDVDARHLMRRLLEHAGIGEIGQLMIRVQPEGDGAVLDLLRKIAGGRRVVRALEQPGAPDGEGEDLRLRTVEPGGMWGETLDAAGRPDGSVYRGWKTFRQLHIY